MLMTNCRYNMPLKKCRNTEKSCLYQVPKKTALRRKKLPAIEGSKSQHLKILFIKDLLKKVELSCNYLF